MDAYSESLWQRGSARKNMREAHRQFRERVKVDSAGAHIAMASVHFTLAGRYLNGLWRVFAVWHMWNAVICVDEVVQRFNLSHVRFSADQHDIMAAVYTKAPRWLGGNLRMARLILGLALSPDHHEANTMKPHTRALMHCSLGEIEWREGNARAAADHFSQARKLIPAISLEKSGDRELQLIRVLKKVGFFYFGSSQQEERLVGETLVVQAIDRARFRSKDQYEKILAEWRKRRLRK